MSEPRDDEAASIEPTVEPRVDPRRRPPPEPPDARRRDARVKDNVLRMGSLVEEQILAALQALVDHDAEAALAVITRDRGVNEVQREVSSLIVTTIATQSAGGARPALPAGAGPRHLRARADGRPRRVGGQAGAQAGPASAPGADYVDLPEMARAVADQVHGVLRALIDIDEAEARAGGRR